MTILSGPMSLMRRHPRRGWVAAMVAILLVVAIGGCSSEDNKQASTLKTKQTTSAPPTTSRGTTTTAAPDTTAPPTTALVATESPPTKPPADGVLIDHGGVPVELPACVNSVAPQCGEFRWEPSPTNQPITIDSITVDPPRPIAGQTVTLTVHWSDPDADNAYMTADCDGAGCPPLCDGNPCPIVIVDPPACSPEKVARGPWTPPAPLPGSGTLVEELQFPTAGTFTWTVHLNTASTAMWDLQRTTGATCGLSDPYASSTDHSDKITVLPQFPTIPG